MPISVIKIVIKIHIFARNYNFLSKLLSVLPSKVLLTRILDFSKREWVILAPSMNITVEFSVF